MSKQVVFDIKSRCANCGKEDLFIQMYEVFLKVLKQRQWRICRSCGYSEEVDTFKERLWSV